MKRGKVNNAINSVNSRTFYNELFGYMLLFASVITLILTIVFYALYKNSANSFTPLIHFRLLSFTMALSTVSAIAVGAFFTLKHREYLRNNNTIYKNGKSYNAAIIDILKKRYKSKHNADIVYFAVKFSFTADGVVIEDTTGYLFHATEIDYFKSLNHLPIVYDKAKNQYIYFIS